MTDFATPPADTVAVNTSYWFSGVAFSIELQPGTNYSANHAVTAIPGAAPRPQVGLVFPRGRS